MSGIFGKPPQSGPAILGGVRIQTSVYGMGRTIVYGVNCISGNLIWYNDFQKHKAPQNSQGGKGGMFSGGKGSGDQFIYSASIMIGLCEGPILGVGSIWDTQGTVGLQVATETYLVPPGGGTFVPSNISTFYGPITVFRNDAYSVIANDFGSAGPVTLGGVQLFPMSPVGGSPGAGQYSFSSGNYTFSAADSGKLMSITYSFGLQPNTYAGTPQQQYGIDVTLLGTRPQTPWSHLTTAYPTQAIGYTGLAIAKAQDSNLGSSATIPQLSYEVFGFLNFGGAINGCDPSAFLVDFCTSPYYGAGLATGDFASLTQYSNYCVANGLLFSPVIDQQRAAADWLADIFMASNSEPFLGSGGQIKVVPYGDVTAVGNGRTFIPNTQPIYDLTSEDFIAEAGVDPVIVGRPTVQDADNSIQVEYWHSGNFYAAAVVEARDQNAVELYGLRQGSSQSFHFITNPQVAALVAQTLLSRSVNVRNKYAFTTGRRYILLEVMDVVTITDPNLGLVKAPVRIKQIEEDEKGNLKFQTEEMPFGVSSPTLYPKQQPTPTLKNTAVLPGPVNTPILFEALSRLNDQLGHAIFMGLSGASPNWGGVNVRASIDGTTYKVIGTFIGSSRMGVLTAILPSHSDPDTTDTLSVDVTQSGATLVGGSADDADNNRTLAYVDGELISYQSATLTSAFHYDLGTKLRRGVFGSTIGSHAIGSKFLRLDTEFFEYDYDASMIGRTLFLKFTSFNIFNMQEELESTVTAYSIAITGSSLGMSVPAHATYRPLADPLTAHSGPILPLLNGDFEESASLPVPHWTRQGAATLAYADGTVHSGSLNNFPFRGNRSLDISCTASGDGVLSDFYAVTVGDVWTLRGWFETSQAFLITYDIQLRFYNSSFVFLSAGPTMTVTGQSSVTDGWQPLANLAATVPASSAWVQVSVKQTAAGTGHIYIDDIRVEGSGAQNIIDVDEFFMQVSGMPNILCNHGQISGVTPGVLNFVYYDDPGFIGQANGALVYHAAQDKATASSLGGRFFVGSIFSPPAGGFDTVGNADGGAGVLPGMITLIYPLSASGAGSTNTGNMFDPDLTTFASFSLTPGASLTNTLLGWAAIIRRIIKRTIKITFAVTSNTLSGTSSLRFQTTGSGAVSFTRTFAAGETTFPFTAEVALPASIVINANLGFDVVVSAAAGTGAAVVAVYDVHIEVTE